MVKRVMGELVAARDSGKSLPGAAHYCGHLRDAVKATHKHPIWGGLAAPLIAELDKLGH